MQAAAATMPAGPGPLFEVGRNCCALAHADRVALLVDGDAYFRAFAQAAERATHSIVIVAWDFCSTTRLHFDQHTRHDQPPARLGDFLNWLARRRRDLHIYILDWDYPMLFGTDREFPPIYGLGWKPHHRIQVVYDDTHPLAGSHHQKIVVIDDALAFIGGFDLTDRRWDTPGHCANDHRRVAGSAPYPPFHDLMMAVDGEAARSLGRIARQRWLEATHGVLPQVPPGCDPWPPELQADLADVDVAIARTQPPSAGRAEVREVEALYLDMIAAARQSIYIENQYFTSSRIGEALARRLTEAQGPEIVLVLRLLSHGWLEEHTMHVLRTRLIRHLREVDRHGRFHIYYAHLEGLAPGTCIDIHAKLMIIDDELLRIGSSNLCNRSMGLDTECDAAIAARGDPLVAAAIRRFRDGLLAEHLDVPVARVEAEIERHGCLHGAIAALQGGPRTLRAFADVPEWPDAVVELAAAVADPERPAPIERLIEEFTPRVPPRSVPSWTGSALKVGGVLLVFLGLALLWQYSPLAQYVNPQKVIAWAHEFAGSPWAPLIILAAYTPACIVMFPRALITLAAAVAFGPLQGFVYAISGILFAAWLSYVAGLRLPRRAVRSLAGGRLNAISETLRRRGLLAMSAIRLVPIAPFVVIGMVAGAIRIRLWHFLVGTLVGMLPGTLAATVFSTQIEAAIEDPSRINYGLIALLAATLLMLSLLVRKWLASQARKDKADAQAGH